MKSNEEFIAGIYEKAALYTEEKESKTAGTGWVAKATRIAAMAAVCIGLAGAGALVLGRAGGQNLSSTPEQTGENYGIALSSEMGDNQGNTAHFRSGPTAEFVTFTGVVEAVDAEEQRIWMQLLFDETAPEEAKGSMVCIKWDMLEQIGEEIKVGTELTATGVLSIYENEASEYHGCAELILTDKENFEIR